MHPLLQVPVFGQLPTYGLSAALGIIAGFFFSEHFAARRGLGKDDASSAFLASMIGAIVGSRLLQTVVEWDRFAHDPIGTLTRTEGGVFYGGLIGAVAGALLFGKLKKHPPALILDSMAPVWSLGHAFGRIGCFFGGCCYGVPTDSFWGVSFPRGSPAYSALSHIDRGLLDGAQTVPLLPTQLFESAGELAITALLMLLILRKVRPGAVIGTYVVAYAALRFVLEFWRFDPERGTLFGGLLSTSQGIALLLFVIASALHVRADLKERAQARSASR